MRRKLLRFGFAALAVALAVPASATESKACVGASCGCPSHLTNGQIACHNTSGSACSSCAYNCEGTSYTWCVCELLTGCGDCPVE